MAVMAIEEQPRPILPRHSARAAVAAAEPPPEDPPEDVELESDEPKEDADAAPDQEWGELDDEFLRELDDVILADVSDAEAASFHHIISVTSPLRNP